MFEGTIGAMAQAHGLSNSGDREQADSGTRLMIVSRSRNT
jgi:hypothetical protein